MSAQNQTTSINKIAFEDIGHYVRRYGKYQSIVIEGGPGIGKSSILDTIVRDTGYNRSYVDCANLSLGDIAMPVIDRENLMLRFAVNEVFHADQNKPVVIMLDELGKSSPEVLNMLLPTILEKRLGSVRLHPDSIVFATTNNEEDNLGDRLPAHVMNRITKVRMAPPKVRTWQAWALANGLPAQLIAFVDITPQVFVAYDDWTETTPNPYIFDPRQGQITQFVSPRSLARCAPYVQDAASGQLPLQDYRILLSGTIGSAAADLLMTLTSLQTSLPSKQDIVRDPVGWAQRVSEDQNLGINAGALLAASMVTSVENQMEFDASATFFLNMERTPEVKFLYQHLVMSSLTRLGSFHSKRRISRELSSQVTAIIA